MTAVARRAILSLVLLLVAGAAALLLVLLNPGGPGLTQAEVSATAEAGRFATAQAQREQTTIAAAATSTVQAQESATERAYESATALVYSNQTATAAALATAHAPATQTAEAINFEAERAQAEATVQALEKVAKPVYGPTSGTLRSPHGDTPSCAGPDLVLGDFIAEVRLTNPYPVSLHPWDYGIVFTNEGEDSDYRLTVNSQRRWSFQLHASGFSITNRDDTNALDLSDTGANTLRLYISQDRATFFANDQYVSGSDMSTFRPNDITAAHHKVSVCSGEVSGDFLPGKSTTYSGFALWSLPRYYNASSTK